MSRIIHFLSNTIEVFESIIYFSRQVIRVFHVNARILPWFFSNFGLPVPYHSVAHHPQCQFCQQGNPKYACWGTQQEQQSVQQQQHRHREHGRARRYYGQTFTSVYCRNDVSQSIDSDKRWMLEQSKSTWTWPQRPHSPWRRTRRHIRPRRARWGVGLRRLFYVRKPWSVESPLCCCVCSVYSCLCVSVLCCVIVCSRVSLVVFFSFLLGGLFWAKHYISILQEIVTHLYLKKKHHTPPPHTSKPTSTTPHNASYSSSYCDNIDVCFRFNSISSLTMQFRSHTSQSPGHTNRQLHWKLSATGGDLSFKPWRYLLLSTHVRRQTPRNNQRRRPKKNAVHCLLLSNTRQDLVKSFAPSHVTCWRFARFITRGSSVMDFTSDVSHSFFWKR